VKLYEVESMLFDARAFGGKPITLPYETEWEKAARGADGARQFPWGDAFDAARCNVKESGFGDTTPVGIFPNGASPYGCLDMAGNVWEWTRILWDKDGEKSEFAYPYEPNDLKHEDLGASDKVQRVVRGGSFGDVGDYARCAFRYKVFRGYRLISIGFRVVLRSSPVL
jgi:formylglycine-generating enzyme required for sulfatase activity